MFAVNVDVFVLKKVRKKLFCNQKFWSQSDSLDNLSGVILKILE